MSQRAILAYLGLACVIGAITAGEVDILGVKIGQVLEIKRQFLIAVSEGVFFSNRTKCAIYNFIYKPWK